MACAARAPRVARKSRVARWICLAVVALVSCVAPPPAEAENHEVSTLPNLPFPTMGGRQLWADRRWYAGWRIQQHVHTGHCRVLDPNDVRRAWGKMEACEAALLRIRQDQKLSLRSDHLVVLLHGLGRSRASLSDLRHALMDAGYEVADVGYPSTRRSIAEHADQVGDLLDHLEGVRTVSFVTHSLGGMVARACLTQPHLWQERMRLNRLVMLAPPSQGSAIAESLKDFLPAQWLLGPAARDLAVREAEALPLPDCAFGIIAGRRAAGRGYNPFLRGEDDGVVRVEETRLPGAEDFLLVEAAHTFLMEKPLVIQAVVGYLETGRFTGS